MIVACNECETKYSLPDENVPEKGIRVRCPKCNFVWKLKAVHSSIPDFDRSKGGFNAESSQTVNAEVWSDEIEDKGVSSGGEMESGSSFEEVDLEERAPSEERVDQQDTNEERNKKERVKRLARVFVSDILVYNQEKRDKALSEGNLMSALGPEIKKGWEGYKGKIGPGIAHSSDYFKDALNEILADGQKIF
ncbi:MAG: zinc-ribbon domain-containing protein [Candidatus Krumholzibacteriota bacterium]|nr:zinc-ribbon domain-containing protein [Candidatus Krumholzibacteriota bacterium]